jgi:HAD superfamily phosphoserine phosphatase-like hydrolase
MKRKFAAFDIDGTVFRSHLYWEVVLSLARSGKLHPELNKRTLKLYDAWKRRTHIEAFEEFVLQTIVAIDGLLEELDPPAYDKALAKALPPVLDHTYFFTKNLIKELKRQDYFLLAVSGSRIEEVEMFAKHHKFDDWVGQVYERTADGKKYTGKVLKTYTDKRILIEKFVKKHDLTYKESYAVGDTGGDISMLESVDNPIAFNPNGALLEHAKKKGWKIIVERKNIVYEMNKENDKYILA